MNSFHSLFETNKSSEILDSGLKTLLVRNEQNLPLPIRRLKEYTGTSTSLEAIGVAVSHLLEKYRQVYSDVQRISVSHLCKIAGIRLIGTPPTRSSSESYSIGRSTRYTGHTGQLIVSKESKLSIEIPRDLDESLCRVSIAHELGHWLIYRRDEGLDYGAFKTGTSPEEEALAEYAARMILIPTPNRLVDRSWSLAKQALLIAGTAGVTLHSAICRLCDPDIESNNVRAVILWKLNPKIPSAEPVGRRLTPHWFEGPGLFVPVGKCHAKAGSLVSRVAAENADIFEEAEEDVSIGTLRGRYLLQTFAWGSLERGSRLILLVCINSSHVNHACGS